jgi:hypothetical protein
MSEWLTWSNAAYAAAIIVGGGLTFAATKYRAFLKEIKEALNTYHEAAKDGVISPKERDRIMKEVLDIASAGVKIFWKF